MAEEVRIGFIGCGIGLWLDPKAILKAYLATWFAVSTIAIGAIGVLFTSYLVRAGWTRDLYLPLSGAALTMPAIGVLFLPVLIGISALYPWAASGDVLPAFKAAYLVDRDRIEPFRRRVDELAEDVEGASVVCTGPWPPYSFTSGQEG